MNQTRVKDLMLALDDYATIAGDATIGEALAALSKAQLGLTYDRHHHRAILVLDRTGRVIGKLTHWAILRSLEPAFFDDTASQVLERSGLSPDFIEQLQGSASQVPVNLEAMCRKAATVRARDAMVQTQESIDEEAPLTAAIRLMVVSHCQSALVTRNDEVVGLLRLSDIFEEVADAIRGRG